jgi:hypothetical protein
MGDSVWEGRQQLPGCIAASQGMKMMTVPEKQACCWWQQ